MTISEKSSQWVRIVPEDAHGHVVSLVLDRPQARNAISRAFAAQVAEATQELAGRGELRAVVLRSSSDVAFRVGADAQRACRGQHRGPLRRPGH